MKISKKLVHHPITKNILCFFLSLYIRLVYHTGRWKVINQQVIENTDITTNGAIFMFWHGRLFIMPCFALSPLRTSIIISPHNDGEFIACTVKYFGFKLIRGSTNRDSNHALRKILYTLQKKEHIAITPDGPRGPRMRINSNIIQIAKRTGTPIIPVTFSASGGHLFKSWDKFLLPRPFGKGVIIYGDSLHIPPNATDDMLHSYKEILENTLNTITLQADTLTGISPVLPEELGASPKKRKASS